MEVFSHIQSCGYVITAEAVKTISSGHAQTHKDYSWYLLKPAAQLDTNPISGQFCDCEHTLKPSSQPAEQPAHAWCSLDTAWSRAERRWQMGAEIPEICEAVTFPPQTVCGESNETLIKQEEETRVGHVKRVIGGMYSARQQAYDSPRAISFISLRQKLTIRDCACWECPNVRDFPFWPD